MRRLKLPKIGRKFAAMYLLAILVMVAGWTVAAAKLASVITGLVALFTAAGAAHTATDIASTKAKAKPEEEESS